MARQLRWSECRPNAAGLWVRSLVRAHTGINQQGIDKWNTSMSLFLKPIKPVIIEGL